MAASIIRVKAMSGRWPGPNTLKYLRQTTGVPRAAAYATARCSAASLETPYGLSGAGRASSRVGYDAASPYTEDDEAMISRLIRGAPSTASSSRWVAATLSSR